MKATSISALRSVAAPRRRPPALALAAIVLAAPFATHAGYTVSGNTLSWTADGWYQVQRPADQQWDLCNSDKNPNRSCTVANGTYTLINHTTGVRTDSIAVPQPTQGQSGFSVSGNVISWGSDGWYQVQNPATAQYDLCNSTKNPARSCTVPNGRYTVINHSTTPVTRWENVAVPSGTTPTPTPPPAPSSACSKYVSTAGSDGNDGISASTPLRSIDTAVARMVAGDTLCIGAGVYPPFSVVGKQGTLQRPITVRAAPDSAGRVTVRAASGSLLVGVYVENSAYVNVEGLSVQQGLRGIEYRSVSGGRIAGNQVSDPLQEGIHVGQKMEGNNFVGVPSSNVTVIGNTVKNTGLRGGIYKDYGEGIYIGTGSKGGDTTHDIVVRDNTVSQTTAEGIEVKAYTYNVSVLNNTVSAVTLPYSGGITIAIDAQGTPGASYVVEDNKVFNIRSRGSSIAGIVVGNGNTKIRNNVIWDIQDGRGIRTLTTFQVPTAKDVLIEGNTVWNPGTPRSISPNDGNGGTGLNAPATLTVRSNTTDDGSAGSTPVAASVFRGPLTGTADSGSGPGSGFARR